MTYHQGSTSGAKAVLGVTFLTLGTGAAVVNLGSLLLHILSLLCAPLVGAAGFAAALGMALLHGLQSAILDPSILSSAVSDILVLFSALVIAAAGLGLLRNPFANAVARQPLGSSVSAKGNQ
jgi:hypothetical protein